MNNKNKMNLKWQNFIGLTIAGIINATGVVFFLKAANLFDSGFSGTAMLLDMVTPSYLNLSVFLIILNVPFYLIGLKKQGIKFTIYSMYAIIVYALMSFLYINVIKVNIADGSPVTGEDILLSAIFGGLVSGIGSGLTIRFGGAIDGVEVMAVIFAKRIGITVGTFVMIYNVLLYVVAGFVFSSWSIPLYSVITYAIGIKVVDFIVTGLDKAKAAMIITSKSEEVAKAVSDEFKMGITIINAKGYYSQQDKVVLYCVVNRFEIGRLNRTIKKIDDDAFVTIVDISDTSAEGISFGKTIRRSGK